MPDTYLISPEEHRNQIEQFSVQRRDYELFARTLKRILEEACAGSFPEALVQARAKTVSSFAEKVVRKCAKYSDAVNQFSDLCAGRVIVQTAEQVKAVQLFIEHNFNVLEKDDKGVLLGKSTFGYRDMHYVVQIKPESDKALGISPDERRAIGDRRAEIQVRTWLQHAWADTLHDRMYKTKLTLSSDIARTGALLAALMEAGDRNFNELAEELDGMIANYAAFAKKEDVENEIRVQKLILDNEPGPEKKPVLAMGLARLWAASGNYAEVINLLEPFQDLYGAKRCELLLELGVGLCRQHRGSPNDDSYKRGLNLLQEALSLCQSPTVPFATHLRKLKSLQARTLAQLAWAMEVMDGEEHQAREKYHQAHECEPSDPYYLAKMLGYDTYIARSEGLPDSMRATIREAIKKCREHALAAIELPYAFFTAGRLSLLIKEDYEALGYYARGVGHVLAGVYCMPHDVLAVEIEWLMRLHFGMKRPPATQHVIDLLRLGQKVSACAGPAASASMPQGKTIVSPVLIVAGGAASIDAAQMAQVAPLLKAALADFAGTVISGGTKSGVPGCTGDAGNELAAMKRKRFRLIGYVPTTLPYDAPPHDGYDELVKFGDGFQPDQILRYWSDILAAGISPKEVLLLGIGGGRISAAEYRIALGLGASVGLVAGTGGSVKTLLEDSIWSGLPNLYALPADFMTVRAFAMPPVKEFDHDEIVAMARHFHEHYVANSHAKLPHNLRPWHKLDDTVQKANIEQARYSIKILEAAGFGVREVPGDIVPFADFTAAELESMAELEHGRWNVERLRDGWRLGERDDLKKIHDCLVSWEALREEIKNFEREAVAAFPEILAQAHLEVFRNEK